MQILKTAFPPPPAVLVAAATAAVAAYGCLLKLFELKQICKFNEAL